LPFFIFFKIQNTFGAERQNNSLQEPLSFKPYIGKEYSSHREDRVCVRARVCVCVNQCSTQYATTCNRICLEKISLSQGNWPVIGSIVSISCPQGPASDPCNDTFYVSPPPHNRHVGMVRPLTADASDGVEVWSVVNVLCQHARLLSPSCSEK
jgi:hypothetical protein